MEWKTWSNSLEMGIKFEFAGFLTSIKNGKLITLKVRASERRNSRKDEFVSGCHLCVRFQGCDCDYRSWIERDGISVGGDPADSILFDGLTERYIVKWRSVADIFGPTFWKADADMFQRI
jgi:hypothetical protein